MMLDQATGLCGGVNRIAERLEVALLRESSELRPSWAAGPRPSLRLGECGVHAVEAEDDHGYVLGLGSGSQPVRLRSERQEQSRRRTHDAVMGGHGRTSMAVRVGMPTAWRVAVALRAALSVRAA